MEREEPVIHRGGELMTTRELLKASLARQALWVVEPKPDVHGLPDYVESLPNLSVPPQRTNDLRRAGWAAVVEITFTESSAKIDDGLINAVFSRLQNRTTALEVDEGSLRIDFQIEDGAPETRALVEEFAKHLMSLPMPEVDEVSVRFNALDVTAIERILVENRAHLRAV